MADPDVVIVGAGLAGLSCGRRLAQCGIPFLILEASDGVGGRVRSDRVDGFTLDRGFQVYLTAYPEGRRVLDLDELQLRPFARSVLVHERGRFHRVYDPRISLRARLRSLLNPVGHSRMARLAWLLDRGPLEELQTADEHLTLDLLRSVGGFGRAEIDRYFRPLFGGLFLDRDLTTSSRLFRFLFRMIADGPAAVPAGGMQVIPNQIASRLPDWSVRLSSIVRQVRHREVSLAGGETIRCRAVVVATDGTEADRLTAGEAACPGWRGLSTLYYEAAASPVREPIVVLDGEGRGPVNHLAVLSDAAPEYAPAARSLIAASTIGVPAEDDAVLDRLVRKQLASWFGGVVDRWRHLRTYRIPHALPDQTAGRLDPWQRPVRLRPGLYVCGDHRDQATIDGAMTSGIRTAQAVMEDLDASRT